MARNPSDNAAVVYVFDAYGTLFDVHSAVRKHASELGRNAQRVSDIWRAKHLEYAWVRSLCGRYRDFWTLADEALDYALAAAAPDAIHLKPALLRAYLELDAYPEVMRILTALKESGLRVAILSNGTSEMLGAAVRSAGIGDLLDTIISVDAVGVYKTDPRAYTLAENELGVAGAAISFQSSNRWDIAGASVHGFTTVWVNRNGQSDEYPDISPDRIVRSLDELIA